MIRSDSISELAVALAAAQAKITPAAKDSENPHFKAHYADLASVWEACRGPLAENGLSVVQTFEQDTPGLITVLTTLLHKSGEWIASALSLPVTQTAHGIGSAITYGRRYSLAALVGVVADEDDDGNAAGATASAGATTQRAKNGVRNGNTSDQAIARGHLDPDKLDPKLGKFIGSFEGWMKSKGLDHADHDLAMYLLNRAAENDDESAWKSRKELTDEDWKRTGKTLTKLPAEELASWVHAHAEARLKAEVHPEAELAPASGPSQPIASTEDDWGDVPADYEPCDTCGGNPAECECRSAELAADPKLESVAA